MNPSSPRTGETKVPAGRNRELVLTTSTTPRRVALRSHSRGLRSLVVLALVVVSIVMPADTASAQGTSALSAEQQLAERYSPVMMLKDQEEECDRNGEGYEPMAVDSLFSNPQIALRQVGTDDPVVKWAPTARDVFGLGKGFYLDFPGGSLEPGCIFERDFRAYTADEKPAVYAHVVVQPDRPDELVLQYWSFWYFNDWNNTHEGDWELIQIVFPASTARRGTASRADSSRLLPARGRRARPTGPTTSSIAMVRTRSCSRRPGRTRATSALRSTSAATAARDSAATTPTARRRASIPR